MVPYQLVRTPPRYADRYPQQQQLVTITQRARPLDGRSVSAAWQRELAAEVPAIAHALGRPPSLAVVVVGQRPDSLLYVSRKLEACTQVRDVHTLPVGLHQFECTRCFTRMKTVMSMCCHMYTVDSPQYTSRWAFMPCCIDYLAP